jgi:hypothetical protein
VIDVNPDSRYPALFDCGKAVPQTRGSLGGAACGGNSLGGDPAAGLDCSAGWLYWCRFRVRRLPDLTGGDAIDLPFAVTLTDLDNINSFKDATASRGRLRCKDSRGTACRWPLCTWVGYAGRHCRAWR